MEPWRGRTAVPQACLPRRSTTDDNRRQWSTTVDNGRQRQLDQLEAHADWILATVGVDIRGDDESLELFRFAGAPGVAFIGSNHTLENFATSNYNSPLANTDSYDHWIEDGGLDTERRANAGWKRVLVEYDPPPIDDSIDRVLLDFIAERNDSMADAWY